MRDLGILLDNGKQMLLLLQLVLPIPVPYPPSRRHVLLSSLRMPEKQSMVGILISASPEARSPQLYLGWS